MFITECEFDNTDLERTSSMGRRHISAFIHFDLCNCV